MKNITAKDKKLAIDKFLNSDCDYSSDTYSIKFYTKEKGLFSGFSRLYNEYENGKAKYKYFGFVIDLVNRSFFVEGVSGKRLKMSVTTLNKLFDYGNAFSNTDNIDLNMFYSMGICYGDSYNEEENIGRGIYRGIQKHPNFEQVFKELYPYQNFNNRLHGISDDLYNIVDNTRKFGTINKALNSINKDIYTRLLTLNLHYINRLLNLSSTYYKDVGKTDALNKTVSSFINTVLQVDKQRGYHDGEEYIKDNILAVITSFWKNDYCVSNIRKVIDNDKTTVKGLFKYLYGSCYHQQGIPSIEEASGILNDYYNMTEEFKNAPKYPRYLKTAHDVVAQNYSILQDGNLNNKVSAYWKANQSKYDAMIGEYFIIDAFNANEISEEGSNNSNCVASYAKSVADGKTNILFLRKKSDIDKSWVTVEVNKNTLVQAYGTFDADLTELQQQLLYTWCSSRGISYKSNIGGAVTDNWESFDKYSYVIPIKNPSKYHANFKEDILKLSDNYVKVINERDNKVSNVLSTVKSA